MARTPRPETPEERAERLEMLEALKSNKEFNTDNYKNPNKKNQGVKIPGDSGYKDKGSGVKIPGDPGYKDKGNGVKIPGDPGYKDTRGGVTISGDPGHKDTGGIRQRADGKYSVDGKTWHTAAEMGIDDSGNNLTEEEEIARIKASRNSLNQKIEESKARKAAQAQTKPQKNENIPKSQGPVNTQAPQSTPEVINEQPKQAPETPVESKESENSGIGPLGVIGGAVLGGLGMLATRGKGARAAKKADTFADKFFSKKSPKPSTKETHNPNNSTKADDIHPNQKGAKAKEEKPIPPKNPKEKPSGGNVKKAGVLGAIGAAMYKVGSEVIKNTAPAVLRRNNINADPHIINTYNGTNTRNFDWSFRLIPPNANKANEYVCGLLTLKSLMTGLQMSESRSNLLVCQDYVFTLEFGSKNSQITSNVKNYLGRFLQIKEDTEFNITSITTDYLGLAGTESYIRQDGMPFGYLFRLSVQERRPLRMEEDSQNTADADKPQDGKEQITADELNKKLT